MTTFENIPEEITINILSRLPQESLFQFIFVSKSWYAFIKDPTNSSLLQRKHILFMHLQKNSDSEKTQLILSDLTLDPSMSLLNHIHLPLPLPFDWDQSPWLDRMSWPFDDDDLDFYEDFHIHDHSHGLVCLTDYRTNIVLCNPTMREFRRLPPSIIILTYPSDYLYDSFLRVIGFGYDPKSRDFKVVRIFCYDAGTVCWKVEIFDLSKDRWREIQEPNIDMGAIPNFGVYHEGTLFWLIIVITTLATVYSFDLSEEVFGRIRLPESLEEKVLEQYREIDMRVLNGSIVIFHYSWPNYNEDDDSTWNNWELESTMDIWKMEKNDESGDVLWSKSFTISLNSEIGRPLMFMNSNHLLTIKKGQIILYNIETQCLKELPIEEQACEDCHFIKNSMCGLNFSTNATYFVESLYSIQGEKY